MNPNFNFTDSMNIEFSDGNRVNLDMTPQFITAVRQFAGLKLDERLSDIHVKQFLISSIQNSLLHNEKLEQE